MIFRATLSITFLMLLGVFAYSQENDRRGENLFPIHSWGIFIAPALIKEGHIDGDKNKYKLSSSPQFGGEVLINYYYNFESNYSLVFSAGGELLVHNFDYEIPKEMFEPVGGTSISFNQVGPVKMTSSCLKAQAELQSKFHKKQKKSWMGAIGLSLLYPIQGGDEYNSGILWGSSSQSVQYYLFIQYNYYEQRPLLNFHISGGHEWIINSRSILQANLKFNFSPVNLAEATYIFNVGSQPEVSGKYKISGSYIGLSISYIFSKIKRR